MRERIKSRRSSRVAMFIEWLFLVVAVCLVGVLMSRMWLRAAGQNDKDLFSFLLQSQAAVAPSTSLPDVLAVPDSTTTPPLENAGITSVAPRFVPLGGEFGSSTTVSLGRFAPDFTLPTLDASTITFSELIGRPTLINFWASWCPPCRTEMPLLMDLYQRYSTDGFVVLGINVTEQDNLEAARAFVDEYDIQFPILLDEDGQVSSDAYGLTGLPMNVFVNVDGVITRIVFGALRPDEVDEYVSEIMPLER